VTALLASVRTEEEAVLAVQAGADIIDLKEPRQGALGALPLPLIERIVRRVRALGDAPLSATIGDLADREIDLMVERVRSTARTGVDFVKVGIVRGPHAARALQALADLPVRVVPLFLADAGLDLDLIGAAYAAGFPIAMVDTADKSAGSLFDCTPFATLQRFVALADESRARAGLAGSLCVDDLPGLTRLAPAIAGFRGALCEGGRTGALVAERVRTLRAALPPLLQNDLGIRQEPARLAGTAG